MADSSLLVTSLRAILLDGEGKIWITRGWEMGNKGTEIEYRILFNKSIYLQEGKY